MNPKQLKKILVESNHLTLTDFLAAEKQAKDKNKTLEEILVAKNLISNQGLGQLVAKILGFPFVNLQKEDIDKNIFQLIPEQTAVNKLAVAFAQTKQGVKVAMNDPNDLDFINLLRKKTNKNILPYYATKNDIESILNLYSQNLREEYEKIIKRLTIQKNNIAQIRRKAIKTNDIKTIKAGLNNIIKGIAMIDKI